MFDFPTVRDLFASAALAGVVANPNSPDAASDKELAIWAYSIADAMMEVREDGSRR